jgi:phosphoserine phosphatase
MPTSDASSVSLSATEFVESVLRLQPKLAAFDCDGTLWSGDAGEGFFSWEMQRGMVSDEIIRWAKGRYAEYLAGKVTEDEMVSEMTTMNAGLDEKEVRRASRQYFEENMASNIFPEMQELVRRLHDRGCEIWAVSSTSEWVIREAMKDFGIPAERILACEVEIENGRITDRLVRVPSGEGKAVAIREVVRRQPDVAFGNSRWDAEMLALSKSPFAVNPTAELKKIAADRGWTMYFPDFIRKA